MTARPIPKRHWRSYGDEPLAAFPSWFMRITCDRCGKDRILNEVHTPLLQRAMTLRDLLTHMRHDGCGGRQGGRSCSPASQQPAGPEDRADHQPDAPT